MGNLIGETFAMSVLFGISKPEGVNQNQAFFYAAVITGSMSLLICCFVTNMKIKVKELPQATKVAINANDDDDYVASGQPAVTSSGDG